MQNRPLFVLAYKELKRLGATPQELFEYERHWRGLAENEAPPCPVCAFKGVDERLGPLEIVSGCQPFRCAHCHAIFDVHGA